MQAINTNGVKDHVCATCFFYPRYGSDGNAPFAGKCRLLKRYKTYDEGTHCTHWSEWTKEKENNYL